MPMVSEAEANPEESEDRKLFTDCIPSKKFFLQESFDWCASITDIMQQRKTIIQYNIIPNARS